MMRTLTLAIERYDRYLPFYDGTVGPPELTPNTILPAAQTTGQGDLQRRCRSS